MLSELQYVGRPRSPRALAIAILVALLVMAVAVGSASAADLPNLGGIGDALKKKAKSITSTGSKTPDKPVDAATDLVGALAENTASDNQQEEIDLGRGVTAKMLGAYDLVADRELQAYVGRVGMIVAMHGERADLPWRFVVVDTPEINAFAVPGGVVLITRGLYGLLASEDELAAVIGHEIAHVQRRHHYEVMKQQKIVGALSGAAASQVTVDNALLDKVWSRATEVMTRGLDKSAEREADSDGMVLAARAGYDSSALLSVLEKIEAGTAHGSDSSMLYSTHPTPADRLAALAGAVTPELEAAARPSPAAQRLRQIATITQ